MKKSLIALAAVAAVGAASAQSVTLGGVYNFGFQKADSGATKADFFDSKINLSGSEDLGGGLKAGFNVEFQMGGRQDITTRASVSEDQVTGAFSAGNQAKATGVWGRNATVSLAGGFGTLTGGRVESTNTHENAKVAGASLNDGFDKSGLAGALTNFNTIGYTTPELAPGLRASVSQLKSLNADFAPAASVLVNAETTVNVLGASYASGPVVAGLAYKMVDAANLVKGKKTELFVTYDLGFAKLGAGLGKNSGQLYSGEKATVILSAVAPVVANLTLGVDYAKRSAGGASAAVTGTGYAVAANYALSKRTKFNATVGKIEGSGLVGEQQYRAGLFHTF